jgi:flavin-dependent dehydrogenase
VEVHWSTSAELYVTPVDERTVGVAVLTAIRGRSYDEWLLEFPDVAKRLAAAAPASVLRGAGPLLQLTRRRSAGRVLLVGDSAGYVDALTGEGLVMGSRQARAAVLAVRRDDPARYEGAWRRATLASSLMTRGLLAASGSAVIRRRLVPAARRFPSVFDAAVRVLE